MNLIQRIRGDMETQRLILRRWRSEDFYDFYLMAADPEVMTPSGARPAESEDHARAMFMASADDRDCFAIVLKETGRPIGKIKLQSDSHRQNYRGAKSVAYQLRKEYWGCGYMTEALGCIVEYAFEKLKLDVLGISHFPENHRSRRVIEKNGFRYEGVIQRAYRRFDGKFFDDVCYSMLRDEYFNMKKY